MKLKRLWPRCPKCGRDLEPHDTMMSCPVCDGKGIPRPRWCTADAYAVRQVTRDIPNAAQASFRASGDGELVWFYRLDGRDGLWTKYERVPVGLILKGKAPPVIEADRGLALYSGVVWIFMRASGYVPPTRKEINTAADVLDTLLADGGEVCFGETKRTARVYGNWTGYEYRVFEAENWAVAVASAAKAKKETIDG